MSRGLSFLTGSCISAGPSKIYGTLSDGTSVELGLAEDIPSVINSLTSTSTTSALSAYQGYLLNQAISSASSGAAIMYTSYTGTGSSMTLSSSISLRLVVILSIDVGIFLSTRNHALMKRNATNALLTGTSVIASTGTSIRITNTTWIAYLSDSGTSYDVVGFG